MFIPFTCLVMNVSKLNTVWILKGQWIAMNRKWCNRYTCIILIKRSFQHWLLGIYGALFRRNKEAAFSNYRMWESLGFVIAYVYSTMICARMKLYIVITVLAVGTICYILVEIRQLRKVRELTSCYELLITFDLFFCMSSIRRSESKRSLRRNLINQTINYQSSRQSELKMRQTMRRMNWKRIL